ncbi:protein ABIL4 [Eutrema salsugineum]|uniref:protein ABIL4 n=1 Tax=Eutrema salsugineum TaxID=72664 RepID=UPI000CED3C5F|nr:protein ABIL4 [Eutrema salsugineum]
MENGSEGIFLEWQTHLSRETGFASKRFSMFVPPKLAAWKDTNKTGSFSFSPILHNNMSNRTQSKRTNSPMRFALLRSGSLLKRSSSPSQPRILDVKTLPEPQRAI